MIIEEGKASDNATYIRKGTTVVLKKGKEVEARQGGFAWRDDALLGDVPGVTIKAESAVDVYMVQHTTLVDYLNEEPTVSGRVFRMMASTLSERIGEASAKMRLEVVAKNAKKEVRKPIGDAQTLNVAKYRQLFNLNKAENLMLRTMCSDAKGVERPQGRQRLVGDLYVFEKHLCSTGRSSAP